MFKRRPCTCGPGSTTRHQNSRHHVQLRLRASFENASRFKTHIPNPIKGDIFPFVFSRFPANIFTDVIISPVHATCLTHLTILHLTALIRFGKQYRLLSAFGSESRRNVAKRKISDVIYRAKVMLKVSGRPKIPQQTVGGDVVHRRKRTFIFEIRP